MMKKILYSLTFLFACQFVLTAQPCIDTAANSLTILSKSSFGGPDCLFSVRFCVQKTSAEAKKIDYSVNATYGTMTRTINVGFLPVGSIICETFTFVADCNSSASFVATGIDATNDPCGVVVDFIILPIRLMEFTGNKTTLGTAKLNWKTGSESNSSYFTIQQSVDGKNFRDVTRVRAAGNSVRELSYAQEVRLVANSANYFRLAMTDKDGSLAHSNVIVLGQRGGRVGVNPSPTSGNVTITGDVSEVELSELEIYDIAGRKMSAYQRIGKKELDLSALESGIYIIRVGDQTERIVKE